MLSCPWEHLDRYPNALGGRRNVGSRGPAMGPAHTPRFFRLLFFNNDRFYLSVAQVGPRDGSKWARACTVMMGDHV